jgi:surfactin family lipopeptide synthetase C
VLSDAKSGEQTLVAFLVAPEKPQAAQLREFLLQYVPDYMVPSKFVMLDSLPLNANGKVDRRALAQSLPAVPPELPAEAYLDPVQEKLIGIWREILGKNDIKLDDNFFELGGHSLLAVRIIARVRTVFGTNVPLRSIFEAPTVAGLAEVIAQCGSESRQEEDIARILSEVEGLSEDEAQRLLEADK